jgi:hypothetical protein
MTHTPCLFAAPPDTVRQSKTGSTSSAYRTTIMTFTPALTRDGASLAHAALQDESCVRQAGTSTVRI